MIAQKRKPYAFWMILFCTLYAVTPFVAQLVASTVTTYAYLLLVLLLIYSIFTSSANAAKAYLTPLLPFVFYRLLTLYILRNAVDSIFTAGYQILLFLLPILAGLYLAKKELFASIYLRKAVLYAFVITMVTTVVGLILYPGASRDLASVSSTEANSSFYSFRNIGGYDFVYYLVLLYPLLILAHKRKKINRFVTLLGIIAIFTVVILSEYATALLFILVTSVFLFFKKDLKVKNVILVLILAVAAYLLFSDLFARFLLWLSETLDSQVLSERLVALAGGREGLTATDDKRLDLYLKSWNSFLRSPLLGKLFDPSLAVGAHSFILDTMAHFGLLGAALIFAMYQEIYKIFFAPYRGKPGYGYLFWTFLQTVLLSLVNTGVWEWALCMLAPILAAAIYYEKPASEPKKEVTTAELLTIRREMPKRKI